MRANKQIFINGRFLTQRITGVQRYAYELVQALDLYLSQISVSTIDRLSFEILAPHDARVTLDLRNIRIRTVGRLRGQAWEQLELPIYSRGSLLFTPCGGPTVLHRDSVVTIHDAAIYAHPRAFSRTYVAWYRFLYRLTAHRARRILTVSNFSKAEIIRWLRIPSERITVTYPGHEQILRTKESEDALEKFGLLDKSYIFAISSMNANKNFSSIVSAMLLLKDLDVRLVVAGGGNHSVFGKGVEIPKHITCTGYVSDAELRTLYQNALCFVFPSIYEGFGFPPIEAMCCGCPVVASNLGSLPEVCGDAALYCDPSDSADIAEQIRSLASDSSLRAKMVAAGWRRRLDFTYSETARQTYELCAEIVDR